MKKIPDTFRHQGIRTPRWLVLEQQWNRLVDEPTATGRVYAMLSRKLIGPDRARQIAEDIATHLGVSVVLVEEFRTGTKKNPTLVHHGYATRAAWHVTGPHDQPVAELYFGNRDTARKVGRFLSELFAMPIRMYQNTEHGSPPLEQHKRMTITTTRRRRGRRNPGSEPAPNEVWPRKGGGRSRILAVTAGRIQALDLSTGERSWIGRNDFLATHRPPPRTNPARSGAARKGRRTVRRAIGSRRMRRSFLRDLREGYAGGANISPRTKHYMRERMKRGQRRQSAQNPIGYKLTWQRYQPGGSRAATGIGDYHVNAQRAQTHAQVMAGDTRPGRGKVLGYSVQLNTYAKNAKGYHWTDLGGASSMREAKAIAQTDWSARSHVAHPNPKGRPTTVREAIAEVIESAKFPVVAKEVRSGKQDPVKSLEFVRRFMGTERSRAIIDQALRLARRFPGRLLDDPVRPNRRRKGPARPLSRRRVGPGRARPAGRGRVNPVPRWVAPGSVRTVKRGKAQVLVGCRRGQWKPKARGRKKCQGPMRALEVRKNPSPSRGGSDLERARQTYAMWSELEPGQVTRHKAPARVPRVAARLGELVSVTYRSNKYDGKMRLYQHETKRPRPVLVTDPDGRDVFIVGGKMQVTADGLVN